MTFGKIIGIASSPTLDAHGHKIATSTLAFPVPIPLLISHSGPEVGVVTETWRERDIVHFRAEVRDEAAWQRIKSGELAAASISFRDHKGEHDAAGVFVWTGGTVKEISICEVGSNPEAIIKIEKREPVHYRADNSDQRKAKPTAEHSSFYNDMVKEYGPEQLKRPASQDLLFMTVSDLQEVMVDVLKRHIRLIEGLHERIAAIEGKALAHYRGVWSADETYSAGAQTTHDGSLWTALQANKDARPGTGDKDNPTWRLAVKRGTA